MFSADLFTPDLFTPDLLTFDLRRRKSSRALVRESMTPAAQCDEVVSVVRSALGARLHVVDLEEVR